MARSFSPLQRSLHGLDLALQSICSAFSWREKISAARQGQRCVHRFRFVCISVIVLSTRLHHNWIYANEKRSGINPVQFDSPKWSWEQQSREGTLSSSQLMFASALSSSFVQSILHGKNTKHRDIPSVHFLETFWRPRETAAELNQHWLAINVIEGWWRSTIHDDILLERTKSFGNL